MTGDASIAEEPYPVDAPGLTPSGVHAVQTVFVFLNCHSSGFMTHLLTLGYTTISNKDIDRIHSLAGNIHYKEKFSVIRLFCFILSKYISIYLSV